MAGHYIIVKGKIHQNDISILNIQNTMAPKFVNETRLQLKSHTDLYTLRVGNVTTPLSPLNRSSRQKVTRDMLELIDITNQMDLAYLQNISLIHKRIYLPLCTSWNWLQN